MKPLAAGDADQADHADGSLLHDDGDRPELQAHRGPAGAGRGAADRRACTGPAPMASNRTAASSPVPDAPVASPERDERDVDPAAVDLLREDDVDAAGSQEAALLHRSHAKLRRIELDRQRHG